MVITVVSREKQTSVETHTVLECNIMGLHTIQPQVKMCMQSKEKSMEVGRKDKITLYYYKKLWQGERR